MKPIVNAFCIAFILSTVVSAFYSCRKTGPADAIVTVVDSVSNPVSGALVILKQDSVISPNTGAQADVYQSQVTDGSGQASFSFKLEAVLFVEVSKGSLEVKDYIRLEQSKQVEKTIVLK
ncbi:MAG: hypothetical protein ACHQNT_01410 [Bacteroidia bacterium]